MNNLIEIKNLYKNYETIKRVNVLKKINFNFKKGKIYSLVGPSGSGKSTLLNLLSLIDKPSSGSIKISNFNINFSKNSENDVLRAKKIGLIYQDKNLLSDFNALENVYLARLALQNNKTQAIEDAKDLIKKLGLLNRIEHFPSELSGGEKQRIAIARALINSPEIILADEPTGNLDTENSNMISKILFSYVKEEGSSLIMVTHDLKLANRSTRKIKIKDGKIK